MKRNEIFTTLAIVISTVGIVILFINAFKLILIAIPIIAVIITLWAIVKVYLPKEETIKLYEFTAKQNIAYILDVKCYSDEELDKTIKIKPTISFMMKEKMDVSKIKVKVKGKTIKHTEQIDAILEKFVDAIQSENEEMNLAFDNIEDKINKFFEKISDKISKF